MRARPASTSVPRAVVLRDECRLLLAGASRGLPVQTARSALSLAVARRWRCQRLLKWAHASDAALLPSQAHHGETFLSETDTEVIPKLCNYFYKQAEPKPSLVQARKPGGCLPVRPCALVRGADVACGLDSAARHSGSSSGMQMGEGATATIPLIYRPACLASKAGCGRGAPLHASASCARTSSR